MKKFPDGYHAVIFFENDSKTYGVRFPDFPGIITYGKTFDEAKEMAAEALSLALESDFDRHQPLPTPRRAKARPGEKTVFIPMDPEVKTAYLIRKWRESSGLTQKQLAGRLGVSFQAYQRMERPGRSNLTVATLQRIATALNGHLELDLHVN